MVKQKKENKKKFKSSKNEKIISLLKETVSIIVGKSGEQIIDILYKKKNVNEFLISKKLNLTINQTRNMLYRLLDKGLVSFIRKKDSKKGGWYTYFWNLDIKKSLELLKEQTKLNIEKLELDLQKRKNDRFYFCPTSSLEYTEEEALENNFICPETGEVLQLKDNSKEINQLDILISKSKLLLEEIKKEIEEIDKKEIKKKEKREKEELRKKEQERKARRKKLERLRKMEKTEKQKKSSKKYKKKK